MSANRQQEDPPWKTEAYKRFIQYCRHERDFSDDTIRAYRADLDQLGGFILTLELGDKLEELGEAELKQYLGWLREQGLAGSTVERKVATLRAFYSFLVKRQFREDNPAGDLTFRDRRRQLPTVWSENEIEKFLELPDTSTGSGRRDRAIFEVLYSTGARVSEAVGLDWGDYAREKNQLKLLGKGGDERVVPLGPPAVQALEGYARKVDTDPDEPMFKNSRGERLSTRGVRYLVDKYSARCSVSKSISPHVFRHSCATHMLNRGANLRVVQELLGHTNISTTQVYTHVSTDQLKRIYDETHPRAHQQDS
ncbi:MAG: tyrosine-type recombinase/integrase [bacterium]